MDIATLASQVWAEIIREKTGVLALIIATASLIKTISEARKNSGEFGVQRLKQQMLALDLKDRQENRKESISN